MTASEFDALYHATRRRLLHQMYALTGNVADAQECVQEAYARAWQHWSRVRAGNPEAWVTTVARRIAISRWRKTRNGGRALLRYSAATEDSGPPSPDHVALVDALRRIPEAQSTAIVLYHLCDLSMEQVAAETGSAVGTVKSRLSRGRAALAHLLSEAGDGTAERHDDSTVMSAGWAAAWWPGR